MLLTFALPFAAQKKAGRYTPPIFDDTCLFPHDYTNKYYALNGIEAPNILGRHDGNDFLSVIGASSNPSHNNVRVLVTLPAYGENGEIRFWAPLGEINEFGFINDQNGTTAKDIASFSPMYVFPNANDPGLAAFTNMRQAALIDDSNLGYYYKSNPLGLRSIIVVNFTDKAFNTKEGMYLMNLMKKKNGAALDDTPIIKSFTDLQEMAKADLISLQPRAANSFPQIGGSYLLSVPIPFTGKSSAIAPDSFLFTVTKKGVPLEGEAMFVTQFGCLQKYGSYCY
ncbi:MAG: hypothetical protein JSS81_11440 [Acidobacteria bacterium]|nr:hypothetical protein [Acidobacteriota bacterium]